MTQVPVRSACVPLPLQIVIDDVGWWCGADDSKQGGPSRTGIARDHCVADYQAIARLGRGLGMRPQAALILCEWDRENVLRGVPTSTWMGTEWDNARWVGPWLEQAAAVLRDGADDLELTLHGVGHEFWRDGEPTRAEWYDEDGRMRPRAQVLAHLEAYAEILRQNDLGPFPTSFVPAAFRYRYGDGENGLAALLRDWGITFLSTPFRGARFGRRPSTAIMGLDHGIVTVDRGVAPAIPWYELGAQPAAAPGPVLGLHWPNILHLDPGRNDEVVDAWIAFLTQLGQRPTRILSRDTASCARQLAAHLSASVTVEAGGRVRCDIGGARGLLPSDQDDLEFALKLEADGPLEVTSPEAQVLRVDAGPGQVTVTIRMPPTLAQCHLLCTPQ